MTTVNMNLNIQAQNMPGLVRQSEQFNKNMQSGAAAPGGTAGSRSVAMKADYVAAKAENQTYNRGRGIGEASTGSATSDFARQASGLGGLVHVYATFAANIFAVSAAFNALSKSMDTVNLVAGLDQIGAASGKNLGSVAKQMVAMADGAISLRDAMSSTAMASAGGMSNTAIIRMTEVAKKASLALGRDLPDSMDRITKGIIKIQPELLDELGIMTRVIPAQQAYALSIGKTASQLTDFEKRQAFANAVLSEGEKKFGSISLQANPYSKLLASATNLLQSGLEVMNKVLSPLVSILASSPTGLALAIGGIATMLLKQAIPAIGAWREGLKAAALEAEQTANRINARFTDFDVARKLGPAQALAAAATKEANVAISNVQTALGKAFSSNSKIVKSAMSGTYDADNMQATIDKQLKSNTTKLKTLEEARRLTANTDTAHLAALDAGIVKQKEQLTYIKAASVENILASQKMAASQNILDKAEESAGKSRYGSEAWQREQIAKRASTKAQSLAVLSNVGSNTESMGAGAAFKSLFADVSQGVEKFDEQGKSVGRFGGALTGLTKYTTLASGSFRILTSTIGTVLNAFAPWLMVIGLASAALSAFDSYMTDSAKEAEAYSGSIDTLTSSVANATRTMEVLAAKDPLDRLSIASVQAVANALKDLSDSSNIAVTSFNKLQGAMGGWDRMKDNIYTFFGGGQVKSLATSLSASISESIKLVGEGPEAEKFKAKLTTLLKIGKFDTTNITKALEKMSDGARIDALRELPELLKSVSTEYNNTASRLTSFTETMDTAVKANKELSNTFALTDPMAKLGTSLLAVSGAMQNLLGSEAEAKTALLDLMQDTSKMAVLGDAYAIKLVGIRDEYISNTASVKQYSDSLAVLVEEQAKLKEAQANAGPTSTNPGMSVTPWAKADASAAMGDKNRQLINTINRLDEAQAKAGKNILSAQEVLSEGMQVAFQKGTKLIDQALGNALEKAAITASRGALVGLTGTAAIDAEKALSNKEAGIQLRAIEVNLKQIFSTEKLTNAIELDRLSREREKKVTGSDEAKKLDEAIKVATGVGKALSLGTVGVSAAVKQGAKYPAAEGAATSTDALIGQSLSGTYAAYKGTEAAKANVMAEQKRAELQRKYQRTMAETAETTVLTLTNERASLQVQVERIGIQDSLRGYATEASMQEKAGLELSILKKANKAEEAVIASKIQGLDLQSKEPLLLQVANSVKLQQTKEGIALTTLQTLNRQKESNKELADSVALDTSRLKNARQLADIMIEMSDISNTGILDSQLSSIDAEESALNIAKQRNTISDDAYTQQKAQLDLAKLDKTSQKERNALIQANNAAATKYSDITRKGLGGTELQIANAELAKADELYAQGVLGVERNIAAQKKAIEATLEWDASTTRLNQGLMNAAGTLTDSFIDATMTGKYEFTDMVNSMLLDLARLELRTQMMNSLQAAAGKEGLFGLVKMGFSALTGGSASPMPEQLSGPGFAAIEANGGVYDQGVRAFAKGGTFSNSIVDSPTVFKFAKGTGLMGEAGPEAIMPLKRDANGVLGVAGGGGGSPTQVIVNNYSGQEVETKESIDSRGQRKIEVSIGNMVAGEIMRSGSMARQSIKNTFGTQPQLIRR